MSGTRDTNGTTTADDGGGLDPQEAALPLEESKQQARRQFDPNPPVVVPARDLVNRRMGASGDWPGTLGAG